jgi:predicted transposase/invertase (TIGR01784 family)
MPLRKDPKTNPHAALVHRTFTQLDHARSELRALLPESILAICDLDSLAVEPGSYVDRRFAQSYSDLLYSVRIAGETALVYVLFEHQSKVHPTMVLRLLDYMVRIWKRRARTHGPALPPIIPVVLHHSDTGWTAARSLHAMIRFPPGAEAELGRLIPDFTFLLDDLSRQSDEELHARAHTVLVELVLWSLRDARTPARLVAHIPAWVEAVRTLLAAESGQAAFQDILEYLSKVLRSSDMDRYQAILEDVVGPAAEETMGTWYSEMSQRERSKGKAEAVVAILQQRGLDITSAQRERIFGCRSAEDLQRWLLRAVTAASTGEALE